MSLPKQSLLVLVLAALIAGSGLFVQYRVARGSGTIHITAAEFDELIASLPEAQRQQYQTESARQEFADQIRQSLSLAREAERLGIANKPEVAYGQSLQRSFRLAQVYRDRHKDAELTDEEMAAFYAAHPAALDELVKNNPRIGARGGVIDERIKRQLADLEIFAERARAEKIDRKPGVALQLRVFTAQMLRDVLTRELQSKIQMSDEQVQRYYREHNSQYEQVRARHILISTRPAQSTASADQKAAAPDKEAARKMAEDILKRARSREDFTALASQYSEDPGSKDRGGDLGYFGRGQMDPAFERSALSLAAGQISDLVETPYGFHIIKVEDHRVAPLEPGLRAEIANIVRQQLLAERVKEIEKRFVVTVDVNLTARKRGSNN